MRNIQQSLIHSSENTYFPPGRGVVICSGLLLYEKLPHPSFSVVPCFDFWEGFPFPSHAMVSLEVGIENYFLLGGYTTFTDCFMSL